MERGGNTVQQGWGLTADNGFQEKSSHIELWYYLHKEILRFGLQEIHFIYIRNTSRLMLCRKIITVYLDENTMSANALRSKIGQSR
jgi:hypothetical protein